MSFQSPVFSLFLGASLFAILPPIGAEDLTPSQEKFFETKIRPVLIQECYGCHSNESGKARGGLRLDTRELTHLGGDSGAAIVPGDLDASLLLNAMEHQDFVMPPKKKLSNSIISDFREWIANGAPDPRISVVREHHSAITDEDIESAKAEFWAYRQPTRPAVPTVGQDWASGDIDRFVAATLDQHDLAPAADAEPHTVLRRLCFDLTGLPPTLEQISAFDRYWQRSPDKAVAYVVDRLLDSPRFGERWGRHWLDLARYAESSGRGVNMTYPHAWRYRDYVIDSFNTDKPYNRFIQEQIAGDLLPVDDDQEWAENLVATTFLAIGPKNLNEQKGAQFEADLVDEQIDVTTRVILGTSVACARCHDHKFDPVPQTDYYALAGIFRNMDTFYGAPASSRGVIGNLQNRRTSNLLRLPVDDPNPFDKLISSDERSRMEDRLQEATEAMREARMNRRKPNAPPMSIQNLARSASEVEYLSAKLGSYDEQGRPISFCMGVQATDDPSDSRLLVRGEIDQLGPEVPRGFPKVLSNSPASIRSGSTGRLEFAEWISSRGNPLTARVMVNRIWQHLIGQGIVRSPENYGSTGLAPTHPKLLDHLAIEFMDSTWSIKSMIRQIATSRTYRMASTFNKSSFQKDPDNQWLWRGEAQRLDAEAMRDAILMTSGQLELERPRASKVAEAGYMRVRDGNLINVFEFTSMVSSRDAGQMNNNELRSRVAPMMRQRFAASGRRPGGGIPPAGSERADMVDSKIRSVYLPIVRDEVPRSLEVFDFADPLMVVGQRESSNTPNQSLYLMNNPFVLKASDELARRVGREAKTTTDRIKQAFLLAYGRTPTSGEVTAVRKFFQKFGGMDTVGGKSKALSAFCQSLIASAEFRYVD